VNIKIAWIGRTKEPAVDSLTEEYLKRISRFAQVEGVGLRDESALRKLCVRERPACRLVLLDSRGKQMTSKEWAGFLREQEGRGSQVLVLAVGGADGFSDETRKAADSVVSLGKITIAHELARLVLLEQVYRAWTILKGHPYHAGH
jgi:23S rRNA (pseudouridine1915-N3)-methyltransferase